MRRDVNPNHRSYSESTRNGEITADLGHAASHGLEAEVPGASCRGVEPTAVVGDFEREAARARLYLDRGRARLGVPGDVGEGLAADCEQFLLGARIDCESRLGTLDADRQAARRPNGRGVFGESLDEARFNSIAPQLEDEGAHLCLSCLCQLCDRAERLPDVAERVVAIVPECLLRRTSVQGGREQRL